MAAGTSVGHHTVLRITSKITIIKMRLAAAVLLLLSTGHAAGALTVAQTALLLLSTGHAAEALTDAQKAAGALGDASLEDPPPPLTLPPPSSPARARVASSPMAKDERKAAAPGQRAERKAELLAALGNPWEGHLWQHNVLPFLQEHGYTLEQVLCTLALSRILTLTLTRVRGPNSHTDPKSNPYP